jgi:hypothetical protein
MRPLVRTSLYGHPSGFGQHYVRSRRLLVLWWRPVVDEIIHNEREFPLEHLAISDLDPKLPNYRVMPPAAWMGVTWSAELALKSSACLVIWNHDDANGSLGDLSNQLPRRHLGYFSTIC